MDVYFSVDVETDGPIPGRFSMLSFALVYAGAFDGKTFYEPPEYIHNFYCELRPIFQEFEPEALEVNGLDRTALFETGQDPRVAMTSAAGWIENIVGKAEPIFVAYPLSFDWTWMYWYFVQFSEIGSPFGFSKCFDIKTAMALTLGRTVKSVGKDRIPNVLKSKSPHTHNALDDAISQAELFSNIFRLERHNG
ncbi:3'-5' exonuclease [Qipengyuania sp. XHP0207]|uniref:3'-5' exonuclease n=1 Tax=Qipengyuania sp. XHP0207 TaxID=3038078 RepID=UPI00241ED6A3|nr:3'-5' exonuclease [Qipengyuania sp. XHP0207]MDG5747371.1 3'-5' exonuclease [Qipengyuania sp. XHP0207]